MVVVYDRVKHRQRFFLGHDDDVSCVAVSPDRTLVASGQVTGTGGRDPRVIVWDPATLATVASLDGGLGLRSVLSVCFSPSGRRLAAVYSGEGTRREKESCGVSNGYCCMDPAGATAAT